MSLFDIVRSEIPLPDGYEGELQSHGLEGASLNYLIRADGRLMIEDVEWEAVPDAQRPYANDPNPRMRLLGAFRVVNREWRDTDFHGDIRLSALEVRAGATAVPHDYVARFTHGNLEYIKIPA